MLRKICYFYIKHSPLLHTEQKSELKSVILNANLIFDFQRAMCDVQFAGTFIWEKEFPEFDNNVSSECWTQRSLCHKPLLKNFKGVSRTMFVFLFTSSCYANKRDNKWIIINCIIIIIITYYWHKRMTERYRN